MEGIKKPKVEQKKMAVYDEDEARLLFVALEKETILWRVMISLALTTGLRRGEFLALEWKYVDLESGVIDVRQSLSYVKDGGYLIKEPKTKNSVRKVSIPPLLLAEMKALKLESNKARMQSGELWHAGEYFFVFSAWHGKPLYPSSVKTWWTRFTKRHSLKYIRFHDLRHTSATLLINKGVHAKIISERLGHANILTTMNVYGHVLRSADQAAAEKFDTLFISKSSKE